MGEEEEVQLTYRCHTKNELKCLVCTVCFGVLHISCFERDFKNGIKIDNKTCICSRECREKHENSQGKESDSIVAQLKEELKNLKTKLEEEHASKNKEKKRRLELEKINQDLKQQIKQNIEDTIKKDDVSRPDSEVLKLKQQLEDVRETTKQSLQLLESKINYKTNETCNTRQYISNLETEGTTRSPKPQHAAANTKKQPDTKNSNQKNPSSRRIGGFQTGNARNMAQTTQEPLTTNNLSIWLHPPKPQIEPGKEERQNENISFQRFQKHINHKKRLGQAEITPENEKHGFSGGDRNAWLYINRVKRHTTEEMVIEYIKSKPGFTNENIAVKEIPSNPNKLKCFVVVAPLRKKDELYDTTFWPNYVGIKRFSFTKHREFLQEAGDFF